jgi:predicted kinase
MKTFLYLLRGNPATGKITVAKIIQKKLQWKLFWFHDLKNAVFSIVEDHKIPRLMDDITLPVISHLLDKKENIIYVRPSPDSKTVEQVRDQVMKRADYSFVVVRLEATYHSLIDRVNGRDDKFRISSQKDLDTYLSEREMVPVEGEIVLDTTNLTSDQVAEKLFKILKK